MASNPPGRCCTVGVKHEGTPVGTSIKVGKHEAYLTTPGAEASNNHGTEKAILIIPDVIGIWQNSQLIADQFAANGYTTLIIDPFKGDPIPLNRPEGFDIFKWLAGGSTGDNPHTKEAVDPIIEEALAYLKQEKGFKKIGAVGYCFGAKYVARHYKNGINVGYMAHPSFVDEDELAGFKAPLAISAAETDAIFTTELRHKSEVILAKKGDPYQIYLYGGTEHGFSVRSDLSVPAQKFAKEQAFLQAVTWFDYWL